MSLTMFLGLCLTAVGVAVTALGYNEHRDAPPAGAVVAAPAVQPSIKRPLLSEGALVGTGIDAALSLRAGLVLKLKLDGVAASDEQIDEQTRVAVGQLIPWVKFLTPAEMDAYRPASKAEPKYEKTGAPFDEPLN